MQIEFVKGGTILTALLLLINAGQLAAQEAVEATAEPQQSQSRQEIKYIDTPVLIMAGIDPVMPLPAAVQDPEDDPEFVARSETIRQYSSAVERIENGGGTWDSGLVEELSSLANLQQLQGYHPEAIATLDRAIHVNRINSGLHTIEQIPAVEKLIDSYLALGNWEQADLYNNYLFYVQQKAFGSNDPRIIPVLDRLANWNLQAFNIGYGESRGLRLSSAQILFNAAVRMVGAHFGKDDERIVTYLNNLAGSAYLVHTNPGLMAEIERPEYRLTQDILRQQLNERTPIAPRGYQVGEQALLDIVEHFAAQEGSTYRLAEALANLGDWYLIFERRRLAGERYLQAWTLLVGRDDGEEAIQRLFGQVVPVPTFSTNSDLMFANSASASQEEPLQYGYADFSFDVTVSGGTRNVRLLSEETPENENLLSRLRREVRLTSFRPLIVDGQPVRSNDNQFRWRYWY